MGSSDGSLGTVGVWANSCKRLHSDYKAVEPKGVSRQSPVAFVQARRDIHARNAGSMYIPPEGYLRHREMTRKKKDTRARVTGAGTPRGPGRPE